MRTCTDAMCAGVRCSTHAADAVYGHIAVDNPGLQGPKEDDGLSPQGSDRQLIQPGMVVVLDSVEDPVLRPMSLPWMVYRFSIRLTIGTPVRSS
jgi:hypothetical protein